MAAGLRIVDLLRHHAEQTPNRVALRIDGEPRSFLQLHQGVLQVAGRLQAIARPGDRVGLWFHNCFAWVECFLALDLLGAVSVPINTRLTGSELRVIMEAATLTAIITTPQYRRRRYTDEAIATLTPAGRSLAVLEASDTLPPTDWPVMTLNGDRCSLSAVRIVRRPLSAPHAQQPLYQRRAFFPLQRHHACAHRVFACRMHARFAIGLGSRAVR
jgi:acyl-CoA synthetase (AMP-forming)/AMP-acid ligase II